MSGLQRIDPIAQGFIQRAAASGKDCSYCKRTKDFAGRDVESVTVEVNSGVIHVMETNRRPFALGDWLQMVGVGAIVFLFGCLIVNGIKGVLKSEVNHGNGNAVQVADRYFG